jgi:hypothetical protein
MGKLDKVFTVYISSYPDSSKADCIVIVPRLLSTDNSALHKESENPLSSSLHSEVTAIKYSLRR